MRRYVQLFLLLTACLGGCRKFVQVPDPPTSIGTETIFSSDETAIAALLGMYSRAVSSQGAFLNGGNTLYPSLSADECTPTMAIPAVAEFSDNTLGSGNIYISQLYGSAYNIIYDANLLIEHVTNNKKITAGTQRQIIGEAMMTRSLIYSRLVTLWGAVPLVLTTNTDVNAVMPRTSTDSVMRQVMKDLHAADSLLGTNYAWEGTGTTERTRPNRWAVRALTARISLQLKDWTVAETAATTVIDSSGAILEPSVDSVFLKGSREALWQLQPVSNDFSTAEAFFFLPPDNPQARPVYVLTPTLLASFGNSDKRKTHWTATKTIGGVQYTYPTKYKKRTGPPYIEYNMVFRLAEIYLIRAEARAQLDKRMDAIADLNLVRSRAGIALLPDTLSHEAVLSAIRQERRTELFAEWGHRWADLKRWGTADAVLTAIKPRWTASAKLYPLPLTDLQRNPALAQNPGY